MTEPQKEHCKNEGRCFDFTMAPKEWRENNVCRLCGCDGDTRPAKESSDKVLDANAIDILKRLADKEPECESSLSDMVRMLWDDYCESNGESDVEIG